MNHRMPVGPFTRQYPQENQYYGGMNQRERNYSYDMRRQNEQMNRQLRWEQPNPQPFFQKNQPPSWADVQGPTGSGVNPRHQHHQSPTKFDFPQAESWGEVQTEQDGNDDIFSTMTHWIPPSQWKKANGQRQIQNQNQIQSPIFHSPPAPAPQTPVQKDDVFENMCEWKVPSASQMSIDLMTPSFPVYSNRAHSLESPTTSMESSEEKNSWKTLEAILNPKSSRSPSVSESEFSTQIDQIGYWNTSNLPQF
ncbi:hypothetical protein GCK72_002250 [Caenorhabditis remanei]|uniref:Uncharacterized protein n=2 Tax=Caenorhabditis remanei TaxID=31234 RepID=E3MGG5_CAERE|nr:hypothetical protein GCK72_002250 [Caenorhabditis remanei]EFP01437.1 hypothetical protein CRE_24011 [Caenorhabditis remanei]KAF1770432.1 hypothetical protein GCK72_002250 [Caenorhabditis remanei]